MPASNLQFPAFLLLLACPIAARAAEDIVIADFAGTDYGGWIITLSVFPLKSSVPDSPPVPMP